MKCFIPTRPPIPGIKSHHHTGKRRKCKQKGTDIFISQTIFCIVERTLIVHCHIKYAEKYYDAENQPVAVMERRPAEISHRQPLLLLYLYLFLCHPCAEPQPDNRQYALHFPGRVFVPGIISPVASSAASADPLDPLQMFSGKRFTLQHFAVFHDLFRFRSPDDHTGHIAVFQIPRQCHLWQGFAPFSCQFIQFFYLLQAAFRNIAFLQKSAVCADTAVRRNAVQIRSEERRVGKECL